MSARSFWLRALVAVAAGALAAAGCWLVGSHTLVLEPASAVPWGDVVHVMDLLKAQKLDRIELRGNSILREEEGGQLSTLSSRDMDISFDEAQHLKLALVKGGARAWATPSVSDAP